MRMYDWAYLQKMRLKHLRHVYSGQGWTLLVYLGIMNLAVMLVMIPQAVNLALSGMDEAQMTQQLTSGSGWGYFLAIGIGLVWLLLWKKPAYLRDVVWKQGKPMKVGGFFSYLSVFMSAQLVMLIVSILMTFLLDQAGVGYESSASISMDDWSMFLYVGLGAPISEEILFRGLVLRSMEPYGKKFAIVASAMLFGLFHGNLTQAPFAFLVGIVLAYVTLEHDIGWAMVLHMFNNLIVSDTLSRIGRMLIGEAGDLLVWLVILGFSIAAIVVLVRNWQKIRAYVRQERDDPLCAKAFFTAPGVIVLLVVLIGSIVIAESMALRF